MDVIVGIDLGGTNIAAGVVAADGSRLLTFRSRPTEPEEGADAVLRRMAGTAREAISAATADHPDIRVLGVGIGAPGPLDTTTGVVLLTPNLGWTDMPIRQRMADALALPTTLDNDANCAVLGEWWQGAAQGCRDVIGLTIGTGVGGGILLNGAIHHGASDCAGEIGHSTIDAHGRRCACGNDGCVEAYAAGPAIARRAAELIASGAESRLAAPGTGPLTAQMVYEAAELGDEVAREVVRDTAKYLGAAVANLINIFNPEVVVLCGGVVRAGDSLFLPLRQEVARRAFRPAVAACRIVPGSLGDAAGVYGAAKSFRQLRSSRVSHPASET